MNTTTFLPRGLFRDREAALANTLVLAVDQHTDQPKGGASMIGATVTVEVPTTSATSVARARTQGDAPTNVQLDVGKFLSACILDDKPSVNRANAYPRRPAERRARSDIDRNTEPRGAG